MMGMNLFVNKALGYKDEYLENWYSYSSVLQDELLEQQKRVLIDSSINLSIGNLKFIYTSEIAKLEEMINEVYQNLKCEDWQVAVCNEVFFTNKIEGVNTTLARTIDIHNGSPILDSDESEHMVLNGFRATKYMNITSDNLTIEKMQKVWKIITGGICHNTEIKGVNWRNGDIRAGTHSDIAVSEIESCMQSLVEFTNSDIFSENILLKACLLHYAFEFIHPFCDGNGRTSRLLMMDYLIKHGYDKLKVVSIAKEIDASRASYDYMFVISENEFLDCTPFIQYLLECIYKAIKGILKL